jgi:hypothetical protein
VRGEKIGKKIGKKIDKKIGEKISEKIGGKRCEGKRETAIYRVQSLANYRRLY